MTEPTYTVAAVARRLGVMSSTLRTWARRYDLGPSDHTPGRHRRYTAADLEMLTAMRRLVNSGVPAATAAQIAKGNPGAVPQVQAAPLSGRGEQAPDAALALFRRVLNLDSAGAEQLISSHLERYGALATWNTVLRPVLTGLGRRWERTGSGVEFEHVLSDIAAVTLRMHTSRQRANSPRPVLLAGSPEELHVLPLLATAAAAAERGIECRFLGPRVPYPALGAAMQRVGPAAVMVWSQFQSTCDCAGLAALPQLRPAARLLVAGPGWPEQLPAAARKVASVEEALDHFAQALG